MIITHSQLSVHTDQTDRSAPGERRKHTGSAGCDETRLLGTLLTDGGAERLVELIRNTLPDIKRGSLAVFGDIFGGRIDNIHTVVGAETNADGSASIHFDQGETLTVWGPSGVDVSPRRFRIMRARRVRWEWFYYGRKQIPANRYFIEHRQQDSSIAVTDNADWFQASYKPSVDRPAVELLGGWEADK